MAVPGVRFLLFRRCDGRAGGISSAPVLPLFFREDEMMKVMMEDNKGGTKIC
jgi:hypothetical protein